MSGQAETVLSMLEDARRSRSESAATAAETSPWQPLHSVTAAEFAAVEELGASPVVGDADAILVPEGGDVIAYGDGGAGKTTLMLDLSVHLAAGEDWLQMPIPAARRVLVIENEGPRSLFRAKIRRKLDAWDGPSLEDRLRIFDKPWSLVLFSDEGHREEIARECIDQNVDVIVAGPVTALGMIDAGTITEVRAFAGLVADIRRRSGRPLTMILVHHQNKAGTVSGAWEGVCDTLLHVQEGGNGHTIVGVQKARWDSKRHRTTLKLAWRPGERFKVEGDRDLREEVLTYLRQHPHSTAKEVAAPLEPDDASGPGIGANEKRIRDVLETEPNVFELVTGEAAKALGRRIDSKLWKVSQGPDSPDSVEVKRGAQKGCEKVAESPLKGLGYRRRTPSAWTHFRVRPPTRLGSRAARNTRTGSTTQPLPRRAEHRRPSNAWCGQRRR